MKTKVVSFLKFFGSKLFSATLVVLLFLLVSWVFPFSFSFSSSQTLARYTTTTTPNISVVPTPLAYTDALHTYELVATTAIQSAERTLNLMVAMFTALIGLAALAAGAASFLYKTARNADERAKSAELSSQDAKNAAESANKQLITLSNNYIELNNRYTDAIQNLIEIRNKTLSIDAAMQAREKGEISQDRYIEAQQWNSWHKWVDLKQETGWHELKVHQTLEIGLMPAIRVAIEMELARAFRGIQDKDLSPQDKEYKQRLISLLEIKFEEKI
jgi:hypothetical protein